MPNSIKGPLSRIALRTALIYAFIGFLWILFSDKLLISIVTDPAIIGKIAIAKGWIFVAVTASLLYLTLRTQLQRFSAEAAARRLAEDEIRRKEAMLHAVVEGTTDAVFVKDREGRFLLLNEAAARFIGRKPSEVLGKKDADFFDPQSAKVIADHDRRVIETEQPSTMEELLTAGGIARTFFANKAPLRDERGNVAGIIGVARDISDRKCMEDALRTSEERLRLATEAAPFGTWDWDVRTGKIIWSDNVWKFFGLKPQPEKLNFETFRNALHPEDRDRVLAAIKQATDKGADYSMEFRIVRPDGTTAWVFSHSRLVRDAAGQVIRLVGVHVDTTEQKRAEEKLRASETLLRTITSKARVGIVLIDSDRRYVFANEAYSQILELGDAPVVGKRVAEVLAPIYDQISPRLDRAFADGEGFNYELVKPSKNGSGERTYFVAYEPRIDISGKAHVIVVLSDITERKLAETKLRESEQRFATVFLKSPIPMALTNLADNRFVDVNDCFLEIYGNSREQIIGKTANELGLWKNPSEREAIFARLKREKRILGANIEIRRKQGDVRDVLLSAETFSIGAEQFMLGMMVDVTDQKLAEAMADGQRQILEGIAKDAPLKDTLDLLLRTVETQSDDMIGSILLLDNDRKHLRHGAAPRLPESYIKAIDGMSIGACAGSCGTAAYRGEPVFVQDIASDPLWADFKALALPLGLRACWSTPIFDKDRRVLGTFATYHRSTGLPTERHQHLIDVATSMAAIAISRSNEERKLRETNERYGIVAHATNDVIWDFDLTLNRIWWSEKVETLFGYRLDGDYTDFTWWLDRLHPDDSPRVKSCWEGLMESKDVYWQCEYRFLRTDGTYAEIHDRGYVLRDSTGRALRTIGAMQDISERKEAENARRQAMSLNQAVLDSLTSNIAVLDQNGRIIAVNQAWKDFAQNNNSAGTPFESLHVGAQYLEVCRPSSEAGDEDASAAMRGIHQILSKERTSFQHEYPCHSPTEQRWFLMNVTPLASEGGGAVVAHIDITPRRQAEAALRASEERFQLAMRGANDGLWDWDLKTNNTYFSPRWKSMLGYEEYELTDHLDTWRELTHPDDAERTLALVNDLIAGKTDKLNTEFRMRHKNGTWLHILSRASLLRREADGTPLRLVGTHHDLTERHQAVAAIQEQLRLKNQLAQLAATVPGTIYTLKAWPDGRSRFIYVSERFEELTGFKPASMYDDATPLIESIHPDDLPGYIAAVRTGSAKMEMQLLQFRQKHPVKGLIWVEIRAVPKRDPEDKDAILWFGFATDITAQKAIQSEFDNQQELLRETGAMAKVGGWEFDPVTGAGHWTDEVARIHDLDPRASTSKEIGLQFYKPGESRDRIAAAVNEIVTKGTPYDLELELISAKGVPKWVRTMGRAAITNGKVTRVFGAFQDITDRKAAEAKLRIREYQLENVLNANPNIIFVKDRDANILLANQALAEFYGLTVAEVIGISHRELQIRMNLPQAEIEQWLADDREVIDSGKTKIVEERSTWSNGSIHWYHTTKLPMILPDGRSGVLVVSEDITDRKRAEVERHALEMQLRQAQKMEAIGQLAGGVAHDFNNLLAVIQMNACLLKEDPILGREQIEMAVDIENAAKRSADLTRQLLLFSRRQTTEMRNLNLNEIVQNVAKMLQRILTENIRMQLSFAPQELFVRADSGMMDQVLMNLAVNSRDAMPNGGQLIIETAVVEMDAAALTKMPQARPGTFACISVTDTGMGISPENITKIFEPFFTTKDVGKGTGLGLATVFGIVQTHNGFIHVTSEVGRGTTFRIYLPRLTEFAKSPSEPNISTQPRGNNETILVVEDEPSLRSLVRSVLTRLGYRVLEAATGVNAYKIWREHRDEIKLLLTDLVMPDGMTGIDLATRLRREKPGLPVIYTSGYSSEVAGRGIPMQEGVNYLGKPVHPHKLAQTVRETLDAAPKS